VYEGMDEVYNRGQMLGPAPRNVAGKKRDIIRQREGTQQMMGMNALW
jgi:hypothetical protein